MKTITKIIFAAAFTSAILFFTSSVALAQFPFNIGSSANSGVGNAITRDASNNIYVTGCFAGTADFLAQGGTHIILNSVGFEDIYVAKYNSLGVCQWAFDVGSGSGDIDNAFGIAVDPQGNVYVTGYFAGTADFDPSNASANLTSNGAQDIFVAKYNTDGIYQWAFNIGSADPNTQYAADGVEGNSIAIDAAGDVLVTGEFVGAANFSGTSGGQDTLKATGPFASDAFVAKYNSDGAYQWGFCLGDATITYGLGVASDANNNVLVTGIFTRTCDFKGTSGSSNPLTIVGGTGAQDVFVAKYNSAGINQWAFNIGTVGISFDQYSSFQFNSYYAAGIATDPFGNVLVTGNFSGADVDFKGTSAGPNTLTAVSGKDVFVAKYNSSGAYQWAFNIGTSNGNPADSASTGTAIATDASGNVYVTGGFQGMADFKGSSGTPNTLTSLGITDAFVATYDSSGAYKCAFNIGSGGNSDNGNAIAVDAGGTVMVTGSFAGTANFNPLGAVSNLTSTGYLDAFVSEYINCIINSGCTATAGPDQSICQGVNSSVTLGGTAINGHTYSWSPSTGLSSSTISQPTANPTATTTYTLTETTTATGCVATATVVVLVGAPPSAPVITSSGPTTFCAGGNDTLNAGSSYAAYLWSNSASTQTIKVTAQGSYSVTVTNSSGCSAASSVTVVTVNPLPADNSGPDKIICPGVSTAIGDVTVSGDTYSWSPATGLSSSTVSQPIANPTTTTTYTLTETITATGCQASNTVKVTVGTAPAPVISASGPTTFCAGSNVTLNAGSGYAAYEWSNGASTQSITVSTQDSYSVTVTNTSGCSGASAATTVTVITLGTPVINQKVDTLICSITASSYQWNLGSSPISGATGKFYIPVQNGNYTVTIEQSGCAATSSIFNYTGVGINTVVADNELKIYPSPASDYFIAESKTAVIQNVTLYDVLGKKVFSVDIQNQYKGTDGKKVTVNIESVTPGVYFVQLKTSNRVSVFRIVKQ